MASNATDEIGALGVVAQLNVPERADCLDRFYKRWHQDHLVINTWFALQAAAPLRSTLATVRKLAAHPDFTVRNPNKVSALIGTFANAWNYPGQETGWEMVHISKLGSWYLLMLISFVLVSLVQPVREPDL